MAHGLRSKPTSVRITGRRGLFLVTLLAIFIVLLNIALGGRISAFTRDMIAPVSSLGGRLGAAIDDSGYFASRRTLEAQVAALQGEVQQDQLQAAAYSALQQQNMSLFVS